MASLIQGVTVGLALLSSLAGLGLPVSSLNALHTYRPNDMNRICGISTIVAYTK